MVTSTLQSLDMEISSTSSLMIRALEASVVDIRKEVKALLEESREERVNSSWIDETTAGSSSETLRIVANSSSHEAENKSESLLTGAERKSKIAKSTSVTQNLAKILCSASDEYTEKKTIKKYMAGSTKPATGNDCFLWQKPCAWNSNCESTWKGIRIKCTEGSAGGSSGSGSSGSSGGGSGASAGSLSSGGSRADAGGTCDFSSVGKLSVEPGSKAQSPKADSPNFCYSLEQTGASPCLPKASKSFRKGNHTGSQNIGNSTETISLINENAYTEVYNFAHALIMFYQEKSQRMTSLMPFLRELQALLGKFVKTINPLEEYMDRNITTSLIGYKLFSLASSFEIYPAFDSAVTLIYWNETLNSTNTVVSRFDWLTPINSAQRYISETIKFYEYLQRLEVQFSSSLTQQRRGLYNVKNLSHWEQPGQNEQGLQVTEDNFPVFAAKVQATFYISTYSEFEFLKHYPDDWWMKLQQLNLVLNTTLNAKLSCTQNKEDIYVSGYIVLLSEALACFPQPLIPDVYIIFFHIVATDTIIVDASTDIDYSDVCADCNNRPVFFLVAPKIIYTVDRVVGGGDVSQPPVTPEKFPGYVTEWMIIAASDMVGLEPTLLKKECKLCKYDKKLFLDRIRALVLLRFPWYVFDSVLDDNYDDKDTLETMMSICYAHARAQKYEVFRLKNPFTPEHAFLYADVTAESSSVQDKYCQSSLYRPWNSEVVVLVYATLNAEMPIGTIKTALSSLLKKFSICKYKGAREKVEILALASALSLKLSPFPGLENLRPENSKATKELLTQLKALEESQQQCGFAKDSLQTSKTLFEEQVKEFQARIDTLTVSEFPEHLKRSRLSVEYCLTALDKAGSEEEKLLLREELNLKGFQAIIMGSSQKRFREGLLFAGMSAYGFAALADNTLIRDETFLPAKDVLQPVETILKDAAKEIENCREEDKKAMEAFLAQALELLGSGCSSNCSFVIAVVQAGQAEVQAYKPKEYTATNVLAEFVKSLLLHYHFDILRYGLRVKIMKALHSYDGLMTDLKLMPILLGLTKSAITTAAFDGYADNWKVELQMVHVTYQNDILGLLNLLDDVVEECHQSLEEALEVLNKYDNETEYVENVFTGYGLAAKKAVTSIQMKISVGFCVGLAESPIPGAEVWFKASGELFSKFVDLIPEFRKHAELKSMQKLLVVSEDVPDNVKELYKDSIRRTVGNMIIGHYFLALEHFKKWVFPYFEEYTELAIDAETGLKAKTTEGLQALYDKAIQLLDKLVDSEQKFRQLSLPKSKNLQAIDFNSSFPFFTWKFQDLGDEITSFLKGEEVSLCSNIRSAGTSDFEGLIVTQINVLVVTSEKNAEIDAALKQELQSEADLELEMGTGFENQFFLDGIVYRIPGAPKKLSRSVSESEAGAPSKSNEAYVHVASGDYHISPYGVWKLKLSKDMSKLKEKSPQLDLILVGKAVGFAWGSSELEEAYDIYRGYAVG